MIGNSRVCTSLTSTHGSSIHAATATDKRDRHGCNNAVRYCEVDALHGVAQSIAICCMEAGFVRMEPARVMLSVLCALLWMLKVRDALWDSVARPIVPLISWRVRMYEHQLLSDPHFDIDGAASRVDRSSCQATLRNDDIRNLFENLGCIRAQKAYLPMLLVPDIYIASMHTTYISGKSLGC